MSDSDIGEVTEHPAEEPPARAPAGDPDAWATACEEDFAAERARRRERYGAPPADAAEELRRLADVLTDRLGRLGSTLPAGLGLAAGPLAAQARAAIEPVIERNADIVQHLAGAGQELMAAYRAAMLGRETRRPGTEERPAEGRGERSEGDEGSQRIDLD